MSKITLDQRAVMALIETDPDFAIEIKRALVAGVVQRIVEKDTKDIIEHIAPEVIKQLRSKEEFVEHAQRELNRALAEEVQWLHGYSCNAEYAFNSRNKRAFSKAIKSIVHEHLVDVRKQITDKITLAINKHKDEIDATVNRAVEDRIPRYIEARVAEGVRQHLAKITESLNTGE